MNAKRCPYCGRPLTPEEAKRVDVKRLRKAAESEARDELARTRAEVAP